MTVLSDTRALGSNADAAAAATGTTARVWEALRSVRDPELDTDVVSLDFVAAVDVSDSRVAHVELRLPTYFCAPNFAFLMVADAHDVVSAAAGVVRADVVLIDHFASDAINAGVAARAGFVTSMAGTEVGEAVAELDELRRTFTERALMAGTDLVVRPLMRAGATPEQVATMTLGEAVESSGASDDLRRLRARRRELGIPSEDSDPLVVDPTGRTVGVDALPLHLRKARSYQVGVDANTSICRGQLAARYGV
ncbi:iron-sulfur cluster assembly protein [Actinomycetospora corticicola]|uniref:Metal-sulfur cluster biosynthetic enzyme n=1 Tax=Actinomycetospora corticicola TaxID=663602 RepID=A0A7Y9DZJ1_9PSEU|nr:iron-sulfur cluster assembly protein [Actinomycetospora corticicola]NYD38403.1 metal-sulfur cluster biosynthetic enzyme [Actinomycetospora corticicola]